MKRKILCLTMALTVCLFLLSVPALAYQQHFFRMEGDELDYYRGEGGDIVIPNYVKSIGDNAFVENFSTTNIFIPEGVTSIGRSAFYYNDHLISVSIPSTVTQIGKSAFARCERLREVVIPEGVTVIRESCFDGCKALTSVQLPSTVTGIEDYAFYDCEKLERIAVPQGVQLGKAVFPASTKVEYVSRESLKQATANDSGLAYPGRTEFEMLGRPVEFQTVVLCDEKGNATNYVKLRDLGWMLKGTEKEFEVEWDGGVKIYTYLSYDKNGTEFESPFDRPCAYTRPGAPTVIDGEFVYLDAVVLTDDAGGGHTYYKLRDLGQALNFNVGWTAGRGVFVEVDRPYDPNN